MLDNSYYKTARSAVQHAIERRRLRLPTDRPIVRVTFDYEPSLDMVNLVRAFGHDAFFVFGQALKITDAYYGCFEADFEPSDQSAEGLSRVATRVLKASDFDDLIAKYRIVMIRLFNFPQHKEIVVNYTDDKERASAV